MEIEFNTNRIQPVRTPQSEAPPQPPVKRAAVDKADFSSKEALDKAIKDLPDTRTQTVERAKELVSSVKYPPQETLDRIANLLAINYPRNPTLP